MNEQTVEVVDIAKLTPRIKRLRLVSTNGKKLVPFSSGSHVTVEIPLGQRVRRNSYSLCSSPYQTDFYDLAVLLTENSRGGSQYLHQITTGTKLKISLPKNNFGLNNLAKKYFLIAGGIGITPLLSMLAYLDESDIPVELYYAAKSPKECAFYELLQQQYSDRILTLKDTPSDKDTAIHKAYPTGNRIKFYFSQKDERISPKQILQNQPLGTHVYLCAPHSLMADCRETAQALGYPNSAIHQEVFGAVKAKKIKPFTAVLTKSKQEIEVSPDKTLLEALEAAGIDHNYSCRAGGCGACEVAVIEGKIDHLDSYYTPEEKAEHDRILACISRAKSKQLIINL